MYGWKAGSVAGFAYSNGLNNLGVTWNAAGFDRFLEALEGSIRGSPLPDTRFLPGLEFRNRLKGALLPSRGMAALPREEVFGKGPGACEGGGVRNPEGAVREF